MSRRQSARRLPSPRLGLRTAAGGRAATFDRLQCAAPRAGDAANAVSAPLRGSFTHSARLNVPPAQVFAAFAEPEIRRRWFRQPGDPARQTYRLDFRAGGSEIATAVFAPLEAEEHIEYSSTFLDIVPDQRIVLSYVLRLDGVVRWAALRTIILTPDGDGTRLRSTSSTPSSSSPTSARMTSRTSKAARDFS